MDGNSERVRRMLTDVAGDDRAKLVVHQVLPNGREAWCEDYAPHEYESGGMKMIREKSNVSLDEQGRLVVRQRQIVYEPRTEIVPPDQVVTSYHRVDRMVTGYHDLSKTQVSDTSGKPVDAKHLTQAITNIGAYWAATNEPPPL